MVTLSDLEDAQAVVEINEDTIEVPNPICLHLLAVKIAVVSTKELSDDDSSSVG
jgi:hypothetical protein